MCGYVSMEICENDVFSVNNHNTQSVNNHDEQANTFMFLKAGPYGETSEDL